MSGVHSGRRRSCQEALPQRQYFLEKTDPPHLMRPPGLASRGCDVSACCKALASDRVSWSSLLEPQQDHGSSSEAHYARVV